MEFVINSSALENEDDLIESQVNAPSEAIASLARNNFVYTDLQSFFWMMKPTTREAKK